MNTWTSIDNKVFNSKEELNIYIKERENKNINSSKNLYRIIGLSKFSSQGYASKYDSIVSDVYTKEDIKLRFNPIERKPWNDYHIEGDLDKIIDSLDLYQVSQQITIHNYDWETKIYINIERLR